MQAARHEPSFLQPTRAPSRLSIELLPKRRVLFNKAHWKAFRSGCLNGAIRVLSCPEEVMAQSYSSYVVAQSKRNPCLQNLCQFISGDCREYDCKIVSLEFFAQDEKPRRTDLDPLELEALLNTDVYGCQGRLIIVEDLSTAIIETLGSYLDIDPLFFASHVHGPTVDIASSKPSIAILPSKALTQNFLSVQYQRTVDFGACSPAPRKMLRNSNVPRKIVLLPPIKNRSIGLEQQSCSILLSTTKSKPWLGNRKLA